MHCLSTTLERSTGWRPRLRNEFSSSVATDASRWNPYVFGKLALGIHGLVPEATGRSCELRKNYSVFIDELLLFDTIPECPRGLILVSMINV